MRDLLGNLRDYLHDPDSWKGERTSLLAILATREGTSVTVIDNVRDGFDAGRTWEQWEGWPELER